MKCLSAGFLLLIWGSPAFASPVDKIVQSFLQLRRDSSGSPAARAYAAIKAQASQSNSLRLAALAMQIRAAKVGHFDKVITAIDEMLATLQAEGAEDLKKRDKCVEDYQKINSTIADVKWKIEKNDAKISKLEKLIDVREKEKTKAIEEIGEITQQVADMTEQRKADNVAFKNKKVNDEKAIALLIDARKALSSYYKNHSIEMGPIEGGVKDAFLQQGPEFEVSADQAPETDFQDKDAHKHESKGVVQLLTQITENLENEIKNDMKSEELAQLEFEKQIKAATELNTTLTERRVNIESVIAKREEEKGDEEEDKSSKESDLDDELNYQSDITPNCDRIIKTFTERAERRTAEMEGLRSAKEYLAGQNQVFLQGGASANGDDDGVLSRTGFLRLSA